MSTQIAVRGHTTVILLLNMRRFVPPEYRRAFESLRGSKALFNTLVTQWPERIQEHPYFQPLDSSSDGEMSVEEIGFATGVFRMRMLEEYSTPAYALDKSRIEFSQPLRSNLQFKRLFQPVWEKWDIQIRPTMTGFFVLTLRRSYHSEPRPLLLLAKDVLRLQAPFDVPSAIRWLAHIREKYKDNPDALHEKEASILYLLKWLDVDLDDDANQRMLYYPVQWKLAMEAVNWFLSKTELVIHDPAQSKSTVIPLRPGQTGRTLPLHDSYIVYHFDEILAPPSVMGKKERATGRIVIGPREIRESRMIRNALASLIEGTVLHMAKEDSRDIARAQHGEEHLESFPTPRWTLADALIQDPARNLGTWSDEVCIMGARTALIIPSRRWREYSLSVSTMPGSIRNIPYLRYWESIERMIAFVLEITVLGRLVESESYKLLTEIANTIETIRGRMFRGNIDIDVTLQDQMIQAAHLRRVASLVQNLSHVSLWSRAEYAMIKAERLLQILDLPQILEHITRNIESINAVADHVDELYLADLSERGNEKATILSIAIAALSLILTWIALPSFWSDWWSVAGNYHVPALIFWGILAVGTFLSLIVIGLSVGFLSLMARNWRNVWQILNRFLR